MASGPLHIAALDVGHADCSVVHIEAKRTVLVIDCGHGDTLLDFLHDQQLPAVTVALVTHNDADHVRGMTTLLENWPVECVALHPTVRHLGGIPRRVLSALQSAISHNGVTVADVSTSCEILKARLSSLDFGAQLIYPNPGQHLQASHSNRESGVIRVQHNGAVALFGGDLDSVGWDAILADRSIPRLLQADVFRFPHHGGSLIQGCKDPSRTADSTRALLDQIRPCVAVISTGQWDGWLHPDPGVMQALREYRNETGCRILCTEVTSLCDAFFPAKQEMAIATLPVQHHSLLVQQGKGCPCAGTVLLRLHAPGVVEVLSEDEHQNVVDNYAVHKCRA